MIRRKIQTALLHTALFLYNAAAFLLINIVMWKNQMWDERKWSQSSQHNK